MADNEKKVIEGFVFDSPQLAKKAQKEAEGVKYIKQRLDMDNPEAVLQVYNKIRMERLFETQVGFSDRKSVV